MKKLLNKLFGFFALFFIVYSFLPATIFAQAIYSYTFDGKASGTQITITLSGVPAADRQKANVFIEPVDTFVSGSLVCPINSTDFRCAASVQPTKTILPNGTIQWTRSASISGGSLYYARAEIDYGQGKTPYISTVKIIATGAETVDAQWPLTYSKECNPSTIIGKLNNTNKQDFTISIQYSRVAMTPEESVPAGAFGPIQSVKGSGSSASYGINEDGTYSFILQNLEKNTQYFIKQIIKSKNGALDIKTDKFKTCQGYIPTGSSQEVSDYNKRSYTLLAPISERLKVVLDQDLCQEYVNEGKLQPGSCDNQISDFINLILQILIGLAVVMLVVQLIIQGYSYMVTDTPFKKTAAKSRIIEASAGLLLALSAYVILNTINPKLVSPDLNIGRLDIGIESFDVGGALGGEFKTWKPIKVSLNTDVYPAAKVAAQKTGINVSFLLAEFKQETGGGVNVGRCTWKQPEAKMKDADKAPFQTITSELGIPTDTTPVSCASGGGSGGAIGYMQFRPATWLDMRNEAKTYLGHTPNPWKVDDALMVAAVYLKKLGASSNMRDAACKYYSGDPCKPGRVPANEFYGNEVMGKKAYYDELIPKLIKEGKIK